MSLVNSTIRKIFDGEIYVGKVQNFDSDTKWYKIVYEDGDEEEMTEDEVRHYLIRNAKRKRRIDSDSEEEEEEEEKNTRKKPRTCLASIEDFLKSITTSEDVIGVLSCNEEDEDSIESLTNSSSFQRLQTLLRNHTNGSSLDIERQIELTRHACNQISTRCSKTNSNWKMMWLNVLRVLAFEKRTCQVMLDFVRSEREAYQDVCRVLGETYQPNIFHDTINDMFPQIKTNNIKEMRVVLRVANFMSSPLRETLFRYVLKERKCHLVSWIQFLLLLNNDDQFNNTKSTLETFLHCIQQQDSEKVEDVLARAVIGITASPIYVRRRIIHLNHSLHSLTDT